MASASHLPEAAGEGEIICFAETSTLDIADVLDLLCRSTAWVVGRLGWLWMGLFLRKHEVVYGDQDSNNIFCLILNLTSL